MVPGPRPMLVTGITTSEQAGFDGMMVALRESITESCRLLLVSALALSAFSGSARAASTDDIPRCGTILFQEAFDNNAFETRGWYDVRPNAVISTLEHVAGSPASFECTFANGATSCSGGRPARHKFPGTQSVYLSFNLKFSDNWVGSGKGYDPHMFHFLTNLDDDYAGLANTFLTTYAELTQGRAVLSLQDSKNVDPNCIKRGNGVVVGCNGDFDSYPFTEERSAATCNGIVGELDRKICYNTGSYWYSQRSWWSGGEAFGNGPAPFDKNNWHFVEVYMALNSIQNGVGVPDGKIRWVQDGQTLISSDQILFRTGRHPTMAFNQLSVAPYIGDGSPIAQSFWVDELTVGTARPGGCVSLQPPQPPILLDQ